MANNLLPGQIGPGIDTTDFTNDVRTDISRFIKEGNTVVFKDEKSAKDYSKKQNTYYYAVFQMGKTTGLFAVPK